MATFRIDPEFRGLLKPLTPAQYSALKLSIETDGIGEGSLWVANLHGDHILLDGHNRYQICVALRIPLPRPKIVKLADRQSCIDWIIQRAGASRDVSAQYLEQLREERNRRILEKRDQGESIRSIAESENISPATVHTVLENQSGVQSEPPTEHLASKIQGKDGKLYSPPKPIFCERCTRTGPVKDCPKCVAARRTKKASGRKKKDKTPRLDGRMTKSGAPGFEIKMLSQHISRAKAEVDKLKKWPGQGKDLRHAACLRLLEEAFKMVKEWHKEALKEKSRAS